jgi:hypothetical protein
MVAALVVGGLRGVAATRRFRLENPGGGVQVARGRPVIFAIWHNRLALCLPVYRFLVQSVAPERQLAALVSASRDGALLAAILESFGAHPVRGSSSRRGPQALLEMASSAERGFDLALTPDGPRGPRYRVQPGAVALAVVTGRPIVPVGINTRWRVTLRSWDRFQIPLPFGHCRVVVGKPVEVKGPDPAALEAARGELEAGLLAITSD